MDTASDPMSATEVADEVREVVSQVLSAPVRSADANVHIDRAAQAIARYAGEVQSPGEATLLAATVSLLAASKASMQAIGECQIEEPFADVYVVLTPDGAHYRCSHTPYHSF
jgi:hypothetical protein